MNGDKMETEEQSSEKMETGSPTGVPSNKIIEEGKYDWNETIQPHIKIAVIGESGCGKSSLILAAKNQIFPHPQEKFASKRYPLNVEVDGKEEACMVAEIDDWDKNVDGRKKFYSEEDTVVLLCFNETHMMEELVKREWMAELDRHNVPKILVRIKKKLGSGKLCRDLTELEGISGYMECCPHEKKGVQEVFQAAAKRVRRP